MSVAVLEHVGTCWNTRSSSGRECFAICKYGQVTHAWQKYSGSRCKICSHGIEVLLEPSNHRARKVPWKYKRTQVVLLLVSQFCIEQCVSMWVRKGGWLKSFGHGSCACSKAGRQGKYDCLGSFSKTSTTILQITELPLKKWTQDYKEFLGNKIARPEDLATKSFHNMCLLLVLFVLSGFAFSAHSTHTISCGASYIAWLVFQHPRFLQSNMPGGDNKKSKLNIYDVLSFGIQLNQIKANKKQTCISPLMLQPASTDCFTFSKDVFTFDLTISYQAIQVYPASAHSRPYRPYLPRWESITRSGKCTL